MNTFTRLKAWTRNVLDTNGFEDAKVYPGPELPDIPGRYVLWTPYGGPGLTTDGVFDERSWQARCVGRQGIWESAEELAGVIDFAMLSHHSSHVEGLWVSEIRRVGGAPNPLQTDDADRTHFVCSYVVSVELALPN